MGSQEEERLRAGIERVIAEGGGPCSFFACPGPDHPVVGMATCSVCYPMIALRELLGEVLVCKEIECISCGKEAPWCSECDCKVTQCWEGVHDAQKPQ